MSYDSEIEFLKEYNDWVREQKAKGVDISPDAFMLDRAKEQALEKLIKIDEYIEAHRENGTFDQRCLDIREILDA